MTDDVIYVEMRPSGKVVVYDKDRKIMNIFRNSIAYRGWLITKGRHYRREVKADV